VVIVDEQQFLQLLAESPKDAELLLAYADWLQEHGREDEALATRMRRLVEGKVEAFTRAGAETTKGYDARVSRKWFAAYPEVRVVLVGYPTITELGLRYMPPGTPGEHRKTTPRPGDPTSAVLYHRKGRGYRTNLVAFIQLA
jgi:uncharacterized protein (TIGR02996 family)